jgi:hypothetical protein
MELPKETGLYCVLLEPNIMTVGNYDADANEWKLSAKLENPVVVFYLQVPDLVKQIQDPTSIVAQQIKRLDTMNAAINKASENAKNYSEKTSSKRKKKNA